MIRQITGTIGQHKIPRYIYHMTSKYNYEKILHSGAINMSEDLMCGKAIFASDLNNLFKRATQQIGDQTLIDKLLEQVSTWGSEIVILRIPTALLDKNKLFVRSHKIAFDFCSYKDIKKAEETLSKECQKSGNWENYLSKLREIFLNGFRKLNNPDIEKHLCNGEPAKFASRYKQRKQGIEYFYRDTIPISLVEKIGECDLKKARQASEYPIRNIFSSLLKNTPEHKATKLLNC